LKSESLSGAPRSRDRAKNPVIRELIRGVRVFSLAIFRETGANCGGRTGARRAAH